MSEIVKERLNTFIFTIAFFILFVLLFLPPSHVINARRALWLIGG